MAPNGHSAESARGSIFAEVAINGPLYKTFHYAVHDGLAARLRVGARVLAPFGHRKTVGYCVAISHESPIAPQSLKHIVDIIDETPLLNSTMLALTRWVADEYLCGWGEALDAALPTGVRKGTKGRQVTIVEAARPYDELLRYAASLEQSTRRARAAGVLRTLAEAGTELTLAEIASETGASASIVQTLAGQGWLKLRKECMALDALAGLHTPRTEPLVPTAHQKAALDEIYRRLDSPEPGVVLLHGVTGSGKTEVYLQALRMAIAEGKQGIVLVPEISLTPQTVRRFASRFDRVAVLHSKLTEAERRDQWLRIRTGQADVVIGARSAIFAPMARLGLVVIDEEHEPSFKQQSVPRYHTVAVAIQRACLEKALVILGSATPSLESYHKAKRGEFAHLILPQRIHDWPLPKVQLVDMSAEQAEQKRYCSLSRKLAAAMNQSLLAGEQVILFLNRRGFSTYITCRRCGYVANCERCDVSLVYHREKGVAKCHYCGREREAPSVCPACGSQAVRYLGVGTQRIEEEIRAGFPHHPCSRMDSDATRARHSHDEILEGFREGRVKILLGTQMIAKGLDFPNVTLVGVLDADVAMHLPDFRASERTFQLLAQVAGRTGRSYKGGRVIVQTSSPDQACVQFAQHHDYAAFAEHEIAHRRALGYPPFGRLTRIVVEAANAEKCGKKCQEIAQMLHMCRGERDVQILGPSEAPIAQIRGRQRWHIVLKEGTPGHMHEMLGASRGILRPSGGAQVIVDVDPINML